jgi:hypothetical protein
VCPGSVNDSPRAILQKLLDGRVRSIWLAGFKLEFSFVVELRCQFWIRYTTSVCGFTRD